MSTNVRGSLPDRPNLDQLKKRAKELKNSKEFDSLADAQLALARAYGFPSWPKIKVYIEQTTLRRLIIAGETDEMIALLESSPRIANLPFPEGDWPLHLAAQYNDPTMIEILVKSGASFRPKYEDSSHTALSWAVTYGSFQAAVKLVELGNQPDLFCAAGLGFMDRVRSFWKDGKLQPHSSQTGSSRYSKSGETLPCPPESDEDKISDALYIASRNGRLAAAQWLLEQGADPNWKGYCGANSLAWAEFSRNADLCALLRQHGASDEAVDDIFMATPKVFPYMIVIAWGFPAEMLKARLEANPEMLNAKGGYGTLLNTAVFNNQIAAAKVLLEMGADRTIANLNGLTPAVLANKKGFHEMEALLTSV